MHSNFIPLVTHWIQCIDGSFQCQCCTCRKFCFYVESMQPYVYNSAPHSVIWHCTYKQFSMAYTSTTYCIITFPPWNNYSLVASQSTPTQTGLPSNGMLHNTIASHEIILDILSLFQRTSYITPHSPKTIKKIKKRKSTFRSWISFHIPCYHQQ